MDEQLMQELKDAIERGALDQAVVLIEKILILRNGG